ncbi:hypothetical protein Nepgr_033923 [Nepenthes gracilis]|uniref:Uncharacterized protein n=1 Tax=Nepenthes gracilis TaxID=150966 RepID=A0AAD3TMM7_NEPGR|nr:hypothetical protein Nepgr_033923 [Nepenthes gracilis]
MSEGRPRCIGPTITAGALMEQIRCSRLLVKTLVRLILAFGGRAVAGALLALVYAGEFFDVILVLCWVMAPEFILFVFLSVRLFLLPR